MKTLLTFLFAAILTVSASAQSCTSTATVDCNLHLSVTVPTANTAWICQLTQGATVLENANVQPDGVTFYFTTVLTDSLDYAVTYHNGFSLGCGYSTRFIAIRGRSTQGCTGGSTCIVTDNPCSPVAPAATPTTTTKKKGKR